MTAAIRRRFRQATVLALLLLSACADNRRGFLSGAPNPPPEVEQACAVANTKCSRCHPIERALVARGIGLGRWQLYVEEMRLKPSSGIAPRDVDTIFRCLRFVEESCPGCKQGRS